MPSTSATLIRKIISRLPRGFLSPGLLLELLFLEEIEKKFEISAEKRRELISIVYAERDLREKAIRVIKN